MAAAASRIVPSVGPPSWRCSQAQPATPPTPNRATMTPNSPVLACSTSRTNTTPSENSAPTPITAVTVAGRTARTIGRRTAAITAAQTPLRAPSCGPPEVTREGPSTLSRRMKA